MKKMTILVCQMLRHDPWRVKVKKGTLHEQRKAITLQGKPSNFNKASKANPECRVKVKKEITTLRGKPGDFKRASKKENPEC